MIASVHTATSNRSNSQQCKYTSALQVRRNTIIQCNTNIERSAWTGLQFHVIKTRANMIYRQQKSIWRVLIYLLCTRLGSMINRRHRPSSSSPSSSSTSSDLTHAGDGVSRAAPVTTQDRQLVEDVLSSSSWVFLLVQAKPTPFHLRWSSQAGAS